MADDDAKTAPTDDATTADTEALPAADAPANDAAPEVAAAAPSPARRPLDTRSVIATAVAIAALAGSFGVGYAVGDHHGGDDRGLRGEFMRMGGPDGVPRMPGGSPQWHGDGPGMRGGPGADGGYGRGESTGGAPDRGRGFRDEQG